MPRGGKKKAGESRILNSSEVQSSPVELSTEELEATGETSFFQRRAH